MMLGPNDPRALRHTGRTWGPDEDGISGPVMVDGAGNEYNVVQGSIKDFTDPNSNFTKLMDRLAKDMVSNEAILENLGAAKDWDI